MRDNTRIVLADSKSDDDRFAAQDFADDLKATAKVAARISTSNSRQSILIGSLDRPAIENALRRTGTVRPRGVDKAMEISQ